MFGLGLVEISVIAFIFVDSINNIIMEKTADERSLSGS